MSRTAALLLGFVVLVQGYTTFSTNCSIPTTSVNYVSSPNSRGTLNLLWSNLFTLFACTWTIQHLNVPEQRDGRDPGWRGDLKWGLKSFWTSTKWMLVTAIAPEVLLAKAWGDLNGAKMDLQKLQDFAKEDGVPWTLTHSLFANMGGFVIRWNIGEIGMKARLDASTQPSSDSSTRITADDSERQRDPDTRTVGDDAVVVQQDEARAEISSQLSRYHPSDDNQSFHDEAQVPAEAFYADSSHFMEPDNLELQTVESSDQVHAGASYANPFHLLAPDILKLREEGILKKLPYLTEEDINDKSKSDGLARVIAAGQIAWTVIQIVTRAVRHLAISQLEVAIIAFAVCAIIIYGLNFKKPKGVSVPYTLLRYTDRIPGRVYNAIPYHDEIDIQRLLHQVSSIFEIKRRGAPISHTAVIFDGEFVGLFSGCTIFGGIHLSAWNFGFPSTSEQIIWKAASLWCTSFIIVFIFLIFLVNFLRFCCNDSDSDWLVWVFATFFIILYILARLFLLIESFRTLLFLPPDIYKTTWASNIPHLA